MRGRHRAVVVLPCSGRCGRVPAAAGVVTVPATPQPPAVFRRAVAALDRIRPRPEVRLTPVKPPQRLAPWAHALGAHVGDDEPELVSARLVLLHDPAGQDAWDGVLRIVVYLRADLETEFAGDPLLPEVGWSWLTEALQGAGAEHAALGGTVTQTSSARFGDIAGPPRSADLELRASWTPLGEDLDPHADAFCELIAFAAGLPPVGVAALAHRNADG
ncbi:MAG: DUF3000 family protein [Pseudonocardiaceae bacterium]|nr:DUF3000 family protein [Pseudonocardiaceae bacterium]